MPDERLDFMKWLALEAGKLLMQHWKKDFQIYRKPDRTVVTEPELRVRDFVTSELRMRFPEDGLLSEESRDTDHRLSKQGIFLVDEGDGSSNYARGEDDFCFMVAYAENGSPRLGVINEPARGLLFYAQNPGPAFVTDGSTTRQLGLLEPVTWQAAKVGHPKNYRGDAYAELYQRLGISDRQLVPVGSIGIRLMQIATEETHLVLGYSHDFKEWDIAAGHAILEALGASVVQMSLMPIQYNREDPQIQPGIMAAHPALRDELFWRMRTTSGYWNRR
jgi:fructose-1,6-bisphosphatase/inositol monophosphatase family enzyme